MKIHNVLENLQIPNRNFWRYFSSHRQKHIGLLCFVNFACYSSAANSLNFCFAFGDRFFGTCTSIVVYWSPCTEEFFMETIPFPRSLNLLPDCSRFYATADITINSRYGDISAKNGCDKWDSYCVKNILTVSLKTWLFRNGYFQE